ncbi:MAG TPA: hypothetical protein VF146_12760 [Bryobacteraceae bacterium]
MKLASVLLLAASLASAAPRLTYSKYFKGSIPEYVAITVERSGAATYQEAKDDENPIKIQLSESDTQVLFELADKLDHFKQAVESGLKVANMGTKTFAFEDGAEKHSVQFNYSQDTNAQALLDWFERITETESHFVNLDRTVHYDKLGVNDVLLQMQITWEHKRLVAPEQFLPLLDRVAKNDTFLHIARERAAALSEAIRKPAPPESAAAPPDKTQP